MPFVDVSVNVPAPREKAEAVKTAIGKLIEVIPGKSESVLMVRVTGDCALWFKGSDEPAAFVEVNINGRSEDADLDKFTPLAAELLEKELGVPRGRIFVKYQQATRWGRG